MHRFSRILVLATALLAPALGHAAPRDASANQRIEQAINEFYLATEFDKAEALLRGVVDACEDRCSPSVKAKAWMYVGLVQGSGKQDISGAQESFQQALAMDPNVSLDDALATPPVRQAFADAAAALGQSVSAGGDGTVVEAGATGPAEAPAGGMECTPDVREVESQRPIPVACTTDEPAVKAVLRYMPFGGDTWAQVAMVKKGGTWQGEIPCADTGVTGTLKFYIQAKDAEGEELDSFGSKKQPAQIAIVAKSDEEPPSYPGKDAPLRCMSSSECPEDMIGTPACPGSSSAGTKGWGAPCDGSSECQSGLLCMQGDSGRTCETAPSCETSSDCPSGAECKGGTCAGGDDGGGDSGPSGPYKKNWLGLHLAYDLVFLAGKQVCAADSSFDCYFGGDNPVDARNVVAGQGGTLNGGIAPGTIRILAAYERLITGSIGVEGRLGFAFNGGPPAPGGGAAFLPIHAEVRGKLWLRKDSFGSKGIRPYVFLGGGMAQVDSKLRVPVQYRVNGVESEVRPVAYRKLGLTFITGGGGAMYAIGQNHGPVLNLNIMFMLPESGMVLEPSLGYSIGL